MHAGFRVFTMSKRAPARERFAALTSPVRLPYPSATQTALERAETLPEVDRRETIQEFCVVPRPTPLNGSIALLEVSV